MIVRPWEKGDTARIDIQEAQAYMGTMTNLDMDFTDLSKQGFAWTGEHDGQIMGVAGLLPQWENRAIAWAVLSKHAGSHFTHIHKAVYKYLVHAPFCRIEAHVDVGFENGVRWMKMLGFEMEGYLKAFRPDGADMLLFARIRK